MTMTLNDFKFKPEFGNVEHIRICEMMGDWQLAVSGGNIPRANKLETTIKKAIKFSMRDKKSTA